MSITIVSGEPVSIIKAIDIEGALFRANHLGVLRMLRKMHKDKQEC
jgi:hypothetical protein